MDTNEMETAFAPLFKEIEEDELEKSKPLLAHYTTVQTLEKILQNREIWLANPLFMNDFEELKWGIQNDVQEFLNNANINNYLSSSNTTK
ncbi:hypothetical protein ACQKLX_16550 [Bosea sp. NPDC003192]|uniref:hypothetical protein n=1 Tax=Bosea sp. NPDC003192 TaxID=3390551 RepID=UPI003CFD0B00